MRSSWRNGFWSPKNDHFEVLKTQVWFRWFSFSFRGDSQVPAVSLLESIDLLLIFNEQMGWESIPFLACWHVMITGQGKHRTPLIDQTLVYESDIGATNAKIRIKKRLNSSSSPHFRILPWFCWNICWDRTREQSTWMAFSGSGQNGYEKDMISFNDCHALVEKLLGKMCKRRRCFSPTKCF